MPIITSTPVEVPGKPPTPHEVQDEALAALRATRAKGYGGDEKDTDADIVFASVQTLARNAHLIRFEQTAFDYIVVDAFHHTAAATYRRIQAVTLLTQSAANPSSPPTCGRCASKKSD